jgi:hypothetical protein
MKSRRPRSVGTGIEEFEIRKKQIDWDDFEQVDTYYAAIWLKYFLLETAKFLQIVQVQ